MVDDSDPITWNKEEYLSIKLDYPLKLQSVCYANHNYLVFKILFGMKDWMNQLNSEGFHELYINNLISHLFRHLLRYYTSSTSLGNCHFLLKIHFLWITNTDIWFETKYIRWAFQILDYKTIPMTVSIKENKYTNIVKICISLHQHYQ